MPLPRPDTADDRLFLLHNPRCSKSRATLALLEENGAAVEILHYLEEPLGVDELRGLQQRLATPVIQWTRTGEDAFREAGLSKQADDETLLAAIAAHPILLQRPILVRGSRAAIGRPPEDVLELL